MIRVSQIEKDDNGTERVEVQFNLPDQTDQTDQADQTNQAHQADEANENQLWIELPKEDNLVWSIILFIVEVGLYHNRRLPNAPKTFLQLLKILDLSFLDAVSDNYYRSDPQNYTYKLESWVLFLPQGFAVRSLFMQFF